MSRLRRAKGFTLIELMIAVAIVGILAAIALPSYQSSVIKANRRNAQAAMLEIAQREQQYLLDQRSYGSIAALNYTLPDNMGTLYTVAVAPLAGPPPSFTITATPKSGSMQVSDGALTLDNLGTKTPAAKW